MFRKHANGPESAVLDAELRICQSPLRSTGTCSPAAVIPSTLELGAADHEVDVDLALVDARLLGLVLDRQRVAGPSAMWLAAFSSISVSKKTVSSGPIRPPPSTSASSPRRVPPSSLAQAARSVSAFSSASILTARPPSNSTRMPLDHRAVELERHRRGHVTVDPQRVRCRERLLAGDVREVRRARRPW